MVAGVKKQEQSSLMVRWGYVRDYLRGVYNELKKVHWPNRNQLVAYTAVVLISVALVAVIIWAFDFLLSYLLELLFNAVQ
ncbi:MAG TPA: preprotein translocase subunit SecE [Syntrophothermus lipocalidus]|uniref:preprotein translocase subunit SecE n=1 Tax=Syntrophothermus lipocalidus TaxID=86170 RepID=UPI00059E8743|nr:preprotein translocase subunit SecE [Syntrophothermus lipocalidus]HHV77810.1 preprotein translocase subunit SecE [Syntrophothermus lipocalidus]HOV43886.1 preprotein translocase subunit SecE [Syntrophothermus lipocalidus]